MRIALVTRRYPPQIGGAERVLGYLAAALAAEGADVTVLTSALEARPGVESGPHGLHVERLATSRVRGLGTWLYMRNLARWFDRNPVDLAYVSMLKHDAYAVLGAGRRHGFPVVLRPEGAGATGDLAWQSWGRFGRTIGRRCRTAEAIVSISPAVRGELIAAGYDPARIHDLPNGVPIPEMPWHRPEAGPLTATFVGRLAPEKGLDTLVESWALVRERRPDARLVLVGEGPERPRLEGQIARLGLAGAARLAGAMSEVEPALRSSSLFVLPSREEGMSIALLEAMALGMPVVASAIPGNRGLVDEGVHGRLFAPDDPTALAGAIAAAWDDPGTAIAMGQAARRRVEDEFSVAAVARGHLALFGQLPRQRS